jgi:hypothetical protein
MGKLLSVSDDLGDLMDSNKGLIKNEYITYKLFVDSAIRDKFRKLGVEAGQDEIIPHLEKLQASKSRHLDKQAVAHTRRRHKLRVARAKRQLKEL